MNKQLDAAAMLIAERIEDLNEDAIEALQQALRKYDPAAMTSDSNFVLERAYMRRISGPLAWEMARLHYGTGEREGLSIRAIADLFDEKRSTVYNRVSKIWKTVENDGLLPDGWRKKTSGGRRTITSHGVTNPDHLYNGNHDRHRNGKNFL